MSKFKILYTFSFPRETEVDEATESVNDAGEKITITKKVKSAQPVDFCLQRPPRSLQDEAELFYNVTVSKGIQAGLLSAALLAKRFGNDGGILSDPEKKAWGEKFVERLKGEMALQKFSLKEGSRSPEEQEEYESLLKKMALLNRELQEFELRQQSLFDVTAEARARTRTIMWWLFFLLHRKDAKGNWVPFFDGEGLEEKQSAYDDFDDEDLYPLEDERKFNAKVITHALQAVSLWYYQRATTQEAFQEMFKQMEEPLAIAQAANEKPE